MVFTLVRPTHVHAQDTRENADFKLALGLYNDKLYAQAEDQLKAFVEKYPSTTLGAEARFTLGNVQLKLKKWGDARATFQDFPIRFPEHSKAPDALWNLGDVFAIERRWADAGSAYARLKTFYPKNRRAAEALMQASRMFTKAGDVENARLVLNAIILEYPQSDLVMEANYAIGLLSIHAGEGERAIQELTRVQNQAAQPAMKARATVAIGRAYAQLGNATEAELRFRDVMTNASKTEAAFEAALRLSDLQRDQRRHTDAANGYDAIASNSAAPAEIRALASQGAAENAYASGDFATAARLYGALVAAVPEDGLADPQLLSRAAAAARKAGDHATAGRLLEQLMADTLSGMDRRLLLVDLAANAREGGNPARAVYYYQTYLDRHGDDPGAPLATLLLAGVYESAYKNPARAAETYLALLHRYGASAVADRAQLGYGRSLEALGKFDDAAEVYAALPAQFPGSAVVEEARLRARDIARFRPGSNAQALPSLVAALAALRDNPSGASVDVALGRLYLEQLKDFDAAERAFAAAAAKASGADADWAAYGRALAALRRAQKNQTPRADAERQLADFVRDRQSSPLRDAAALELYTSRSEGAGSVLVLEAAAAFLAANPGIRANEVKLDYAIALQRSGRDADAEKECTALISAAGDDPSGQGALYARGLARAAQKKFPEAVADLRQYGTVAPTGPYAPQVLFALGATLSRMGQYSDAALAFETCADRFLYAPLADSALAAALHAYVEAGQLPRAARRSAELLAAAERNPFTDPLVLEERLYLRALMLARAKDASRAKTTLTRYINEYPKGRHTGDVYFALGQIAKDEGKTALATSYLQKAGSIGSNVQARKDAADLLLGEGRNDEASREYEQLAAASASKLEKTYALSRMIVALYRADRLEAARAKVEEFRAAYPDAASLFEEFEVERGRLLFRQKKYSDAMDVFEEAEDSDTPEIAALGLYWQGRVFDAENKTEKAGTAYGTVLKKYPRAAAAVDASLGLARMALRAEQWDIASQNFKSVVESGTAPQSAVKESLDGLIVCYEEMKMFDAGAEMVKRFLAQWPADASAFQKRILLGEFYYRLGYYSQAIAHFESLLAEAPADDQAVIRYSIGDCYYYKGDFTQAALEYLKVPYLVVRKTEVDWTASAYDGAAKCYIKLEKFDLAKDLYQKIIDTPGLDQRFKAQAAKEIEKLNNR